MKDQDAPALRPPDDGAVDRIAGVLGGGLALRPGTSRRSTVQVLDTFDGRLFRAGLSLERRGRRLALVRLADDEEAAGATLDAGRPGRVLEDLPEGPLRAALAPVIRGRALLPLPRLSRRRRSFAVLDGEGATVLRLAWTDLRSPDGEAVAPAVAVLRLLPLAGHGAAARAVGLALREAGWREEPQPALALFLAARGLAPGGVSSRPDVELKPGMTAQEALRRILARLLQVMRQNEAGVLADTDPEFLHDYRVALRRSRAVLGQARGVFSERITNRTRDGLAALQRLSGRVRDLDVLLQAREELLELLPEDLRPGLDPVFRALRAERGRERQAMVLGLRDPEGRRVLDEWQAFLEGRLEDPGGPKAGTPVAALARRRLRRRYGGIANRAWTAADATEDGQLHALRIACKKLRYLLESFRDLFPDDGLVAVIDRLKELQELLGGMNDLAEQVRTLRAHLPRDEDGRMAWRRAAALGGLVAMLSRRKLELRERLQPVIDDFTSPRAQARFAALLAAGRRQAPGPGAGV